MVRAVAFHLEAPGNLAGRRFNGHHIGEAGAGDNQQPAVLGAVHVVHVLVVAFTDQVANRLEKYQPHRVEQDFGHTPALVGNTVDAPDILVGVGVDHIDHAFPVVANKDHIAGVFGLDGRRGDGQHTGQQKGSGASALAEGFHSFHGEFSGFYCCYYLFRRTLVPFLGNQTHDATDTRPVISANFRYKKGQVSACPFDFSRLPGWYQNAGTTAPSYFSMMKSFTASDFSALASFCMASLSLLSGRATRMFTYGDSAPSITRASSDGFRPASSA